MELQLGKQKRMMYARVFDRTEEETCSADAVVPDALGDIGTIVVTEGTFCLWNLDFSDKSAQIEGSVAARRSRRTCGRGCAVRSPRWMRARSIRARCASRRG